MTQYIIAEKGDIDFDLDACKSFSTYADASLYREMLERQNPDKKYVIWDID